MINWITNTRRSFSAKLSLWILLLTVPVFFASVGLLFHQSHRMIYGESVERANGVLDASLQRLGRYLITIETMKLREPSSSKISLVGSDSRM